MPTTAKRQRATAIIPFEHGILLTGMRYMAYMLPGGGITRGEQPHEAVVREVFEETRLEAQTVQFLFEYQSYVQHHVVYLIHTTGTPIPSEEVQFIAYYPTKEALRISNDTQYIIKRYLDQK